ncbi:MAG: hypothetical protein JSV21_10970 [Nitrospirota bacterium]|nr:MAG: hypothetical protein JSV21_10970 [Nitrospirota bacterium]
MRNKAVIALALIIILLLSLFYLGRGLLYKVPVPDVVSGEKKVSGDVIEAGDTKERSNFDSIVTRNVFNPERKYEASPAGDPGAAIDEIPAQMPALVVKGIVKNPEGEFIAYISKDGEAPRPVRAGERFENIKIVNINETDVKIKWNNSEIDLSLKKVRTGGNLKK